MGGLFSSWTLHTSFYQRSFITGSICSFAFFFHFLVLTTLIVLPFVLTFYSGNFWAKIDVQTEQPKVTYQHQLYTQLYFTSQTNQQGSYVWATSKAIRA